ncbi:cell filamentation protein [Amphibacillus marinus]|uniref:protein adenylyltransferase n=1 Tax=Amphibacillus marinus TaxID=872970 RepID=A0A1H8NUT3_9BACI|nr:Fic family protein [Amphibacillus marinus]SEO33395.1 cell filamentation protein [Amphibacillus marinus]
MDQISEEYLSKQRALELWDSGYINKIEAGTTKGLKEIHRYLFSGLEGYNAGEIREVNISKDDFLFAPALYLQETLETVEKLPENTFTEIITKYAEMNVAHPFLEGNGRATRIWLDQILRKQLKLCIDWQQISKYDYLNYMKHSKNNTKNIEQLLKQALTDQSYDRVLYMKGIDKSFEYEDLSAYQTVRIDAELNNK